MTSIIGSLRLFSACVDFLEIGGTDTAENGRIEKDVSILRLESTEGLLFYKMYAFTTEWIE